MKETGLVAKIIREGLAQIEFKGTSACAKCGKCSMGLSGEMFVEAENKIQAKIGDTVEVEFFSVISSSFIVYILPIVFLVIGYFIGVMVFPLVSIEVSMENLGIIFAIAFLFISFALLKIYDLFVSKLRKPCAVILRKVGEK